jgi:hypothetical protein
MNRRLYIRRVKTHSVLFTQLRIDKIGFNEFLYERRVPGFNTKRYICDYSTISVRYVLLSCLRWIDKRKKELGKLSRDLKKVLGIEYGATAAIKLILRTGLLE